jgi:hypothetical protein
MKNLLLTAILFLCLKNTMAQSFATVDMRCDSTIGFSSLTQIPSGSFYAVGGENVAPHNIVDSPNACLYKLDANMNIIWKNFYGGSKIDMLRGMKYYRNGKLLCWGYTTSSDGNLSNASWPLANLESIWVCIMDTNGNYLHGVTYGYGSCCGEFEVDYTNDGTIYIAGTSVYNYGDFANTNNQFLVYNAFVAKLDSQLNKKVIRVFQGSKNDYGGKLKAISNNNIIISVQSKSDDGDFVVNTPTPSGVNVIINIDSNLSTKWIKRFGCPGNQAEEVLYDSLTRSIYCLNYTSCKTYDCQDTNYAYLNDYGNGYTWINKLDTNGNIKWSRIYGGFNTNISKAPAVGPYNAVLDNGFLYVLNNARGTDNRDLGTDSAELWIIKLDTATGKLLAKQRFGNKDVSSLGVYKPLVKAQGTNYYYCLLYARNTFYYLNSLNCIVDTLPSSKSTNHIFKLIEWPTGVSEVDKEIDGIKIYPNPADKEVVIEVSEQTTKQNYKLQIIDINGKIIFEKKSKALKNIVDVSQFANGVYTIKITQNNNQLTKKLISN